MYQNRIALKESLPRMKTPPFTYSTGIATPRKFVQVWEYTSSPPLRSYEGRFHVHYPLDNLSRNTHATCLRDQGLENVGARLVGVKPLDYIRPENKYVTGFPGAFCAIYLPVPARIRDDNIP